MTNDIKIPDFEVQEVFTSLSQVIDWGLYQYNIPDTWKESQGENITVYVLDTGCVNHSDLIANVICGKGFVFGESEVDERSGHSHMCSGVIAAENNTSGMVGISPKSKIVTLKCLSNNGTGSSQSIADALKFCIEAKKGLHQIDPPDIISMSLGAPRPLGTLIHAMIKELYDMNVPIFAAAGNSGTSGVSYPAKYPETIAVGSHDREKRISNFSSFGPEIDFAAPGSDIYTTGLNNTYVRVNGTSFACPALAAITALMLAKHKKQEQETGKNDCKTVQDIKDHLIKYAIDQGPKGKDEKWGYGIIDVPKLISHGEKVEDWKPEQPTFEKSWWQKLLKWFFG